MTLLWLKAACIERNRRMIKTALSFCNHFIPLSPKKAAFYVDESAVIVTFVHYRFPTSAEGHG